MIIAKEFTKIACVTGLFIISISWGLSFINHFYTPPVAALGTFFLLTAIVCSVLKPLRAREIYLTIGSMILVIALSLFPVWGGAGKTATVSEGKIVVQKTSKQFFRFWDLGFKWQ